MCGVCLALDATETGDRPCSPRWRHRQSWRGQGGGTHPPGPRKPLDGGRVRTKRAQRSGPSPREGPQNLPGRGAPRPGPGITVHRVEAGGRDGVQAEGVEEAQRRRAGCIQETGRRERWPEGGVCGESECRGSRLARHGPPGHEGPRVQGQTAVTLCWRQWQPHGCLCGWKRSH